MKCVFLPSVSRSSYCGSFKGTSYDFVSKHIKTQKVNKINIKNVNIFLTYKNIDNSERRGYIGLTEYRKY